MHSLNKSHAPNGTFRFELVPTKPYFWTIKHSLVVLVFGLANAFAAPIQDGSSTSTTQNPAGRVFKVVVLSGAGDSMPARHGIEKLESALRARGVIVSETSADINKADTVILAGITGISGPAVDYLGSKAPSDPEALSVRKGAAYRKKPAIVLCGGDGTGLMYAALDLAQRVSWTATGSNPFALHGALMKNHSSGTAVLLPSP